MIRWEMYIWPHLTDIPVSLSFTRHSIQYHIAFVINLASIFLNQFGEFLLQRP